MQRIEGYKNARVALETANVARSFSSSPEIEKRVQEICAAVRAEGDAALAEFLNEYPSADRQHLRQLARNAKEEKLKNKPPHAFRDLFRELRELVVDHPEDENQSTNQPE